MRRRVLLLCLVLVSCARNTAPIPSPPIAKAPTPVEAGIDLLLAHETVTGLSATPSPARFDVIYDRLYGKGALPPDPVPFDEAAFRAELAKAGGGPQEGPWYVIDDRGAGFQNRVHRLYLAVRAPLAARAVGEIPTAVRKKAIRAWFKVLQQLDEYPRTTSAVLFVEEQDDPTAREILRGFAASHPGAVHGETVPFAERVAPGISHADQPNEPWPALHAPHSFGSFVSAVIDEAFEREKPQNRDALVGATLRGLQRYGIDPARPWLHGTAPK